MDWSFFSREIRIVTREFTIRSVKLPSFWFLHQIQMLLLRIIRLYPHAMTSFPRTKMSKLYAIEWTADRPNRCKSQEVAIVHCVRCGPTRGWWDIGVYCERDVSYVPPFVRFVVVRPVKPRWPTMDLSTTPRRMTETVADLQKTRVAKSVFSIRSLVNVEEAELPVVEDTEKQSELYNDPSSFQVLSNFAKNSTKEVVLLFNDSIRMICSVNETSCSYCMKK